MRLESNGGYWRAVWIDSNGRRRRKGLGSVAKVSKAAAKRKLRDLIGKHAITPAARDVGRAPTLRVWADHWLGGIGNEATERLYRRSIDYLIEFAGEGIRLDKVTRQHANHWRQWLAGKKIVPGDGRERAAMTETTIRKHLRHARAMFGAAKRLDLVAINPFDRESCSVPAVDKDWQYIDVGDQLTALLDAAPSDGWRCLIALSRLAGLRLGESLRLTWADIDWQGRKLTVQHEGEATTKRRRRVVPIQPRLYDVLLQAFEAAAEGQGAVCVVVTRNLHGQFARIIQAAGFVPWSKPFHTLRKNCESDWLAEYPVMDVCSWLGHSPTVAAKHYHQTKDETIRAVTGTAMGDDAQELTALLAKADPETLAKVKALLSGQNQNQKAPN